MPVKFIPCRRRDDHTVTQNIAESALPYVSADWEPIPEGEAEQPAAAPVPAAREDRGTASESAQVERIPDAEKEKPQTARGSRGTRDNKT
jgi:hypothetical protein